jgi:antitoxin MazE
MITKVIKIGNSRGIRLPSPIVEQLGAPDSLEVEVHADHLVLTPVRKPRSGWDQQFAKAARLRDDKSARDWQGLRSDWDESDWKWK